MPCSYRTGSASDRPNGPLRHRMVAPRWRLGFRLVRESLLAPSVVHFDGLAGSRDVNSW